MLYLWAGWFDPRIYVLGVVYIPTDARFFCCSLFVSLKMIMVMSGRKSGR